MLLEAVKSLDAEMQWSTLGKGDIESAATTFGSIQAIDRVPRRLP
jgi:hypothetical protein